VSAIHAIDLDAFILLLQTDLSIPHRNFPSTEYRKLTNPMTPSISASNSHDDRPLIADLLATHSEAIKSVQEGIKAHDVGNELYIKGGNPQCYDDIWILRFVLSHRSNVKSATKAAIKTMIFREEKKLNVVGDLRHKIKNYCGEDNDAFSTNVATDLPGRKLYNSCCEKEAIINFLPDKNRSILSITQLYKINLDKIVTKMSEEEYAEWYLYYKEAIYQVLDEITRRTGKLTKYVKIADMTNMQLLKMNRTFIKMDATISKKNEDFYPQLIGGVFVFNSPGWVSGFFKIFVKPFFPKRLVENIVFLPSLSKMKKSKKSFESILRFTSEEHLPEKYGGMNKTCPLPHVGSQFLQD